METGLSGAHAFITGASGGIGLATARAFLDEGAVVSLHFNQHDTLTPLVEELPQRAMAVRADATREDEVAESIGAAVRRFGPIQVMVVNHGVWSGNAAPLWTMSLEQWNHTIAVDLTGAFLFARDYLRQLEGVDDEMRNLSLIFVGSTAGKFGEARHADYATAKAGLMYGLTRSLKNEVEALHPRARVNAVMPGWTRTPMAEASLADEHAVKQILATMPLKKIALPADVAASILFLASERLSGHITGQIMEVCGGMEGRVLDPST